MSTFFDKPALQADHKIDGEKIQSVETGKQPFQKTIRVTNIAIVLTLLCLVFLFQGQAKSSTPSDNAILQAMQEELQRSFLQLKHGGKAPLYYIAYRLNDMTFESITAQNGAITYEYPLKIWRMLAIDLRVGDPHLDNTHFLRGDRSEAPHMFVQAGENDSILPEYGGGVPLRQSLWLKTDEAFKEAQERYAKLRADNDVLSTEEDKSGDFSLQAAKTFSGPINQVKIDDTLWRNRVRSLSAIFLKHPMIKESSVSFTAKPEVRYIVTSEGSRLMEQDSNYLLHMEASTLSDGMKLDLVDNIVTADPAQIPDDATLQKRVENLAGSLEKLAQAPAAEAYVGPAILSGRAAAVFFHETFGHRIEGHRQKRETEGKTFASKIGTRIMPSFISIVDDPTIQQVRGLYLNGSYKFDDEGVPAQRVTLVKNGILTGFLLSRAPVQGFSASNGHGRGSAGWNAVARQSNLLVSADARMQVSPQELRNRLRQEAKRQHKSYGLYFDEIAGGETWTTRESSQSYSVHPVRVYKVFVDGRPDQLIRGVDIVGTPLESLEKIMLAGTDYAVFDGECGAESGEIPVAAGAPSLLLQSIEIKRSSKVFEKLPILADPTKSIK